MARISRAKGVTNLASWESPPGVSQRGLWYQPSRSLLASPMNQPIDRPARTLIPKAPPADSRWGFPRAGFCDSMAREDSRHAFSGQIARGLFGRGAARAGPPVEERQPEPPASLVGRGSDLLPENWAVQS